MREKHPFGIYAPESYRTLAPNEWVREDDIWTASPLHKAGVFFQVLDVSWCNKTPDDIRKASHNPTLTIFRKDHRLV